MAWLAEAWGQISTGDSAAGCKKKFNFHMVAGAGSGVGVHAGVPRSPPL